MFQGLQEGLKKLDIFGQTITLNMNKSNYYTTSFGGLSSILIICLVSAIFFSNILAFFAMQNVTHENELVISNDPKIIEFNSENQMFAFSISQPNFINKPFFNITFEQKVYKRELNGIVNKFSQLIPLRPCILEDFNSIFLKEGIDFTDQFQLLGMSSMLCPLKNYTSLLKGTYSSEVFQFMRISVKDCNQAQDNVLWSPQCANDEERASFLLENGQFKLQIIQINTVINPQNSLNYKTLFIDTDMYFSFVPKKLARVANIFYREIQVFNDQSILPLKDIKKENIIMRKQEDYRDLTELGRDSDDNYAIIYMRRSSFSEIINRKYQKLGDLLSFLGGFMQIMQVIFGFIITFYNKISMFTELANKLYDFKDEYEVRKPRHANTVKFQGQKYQHNALSMEQQFQASFGASNEFSNLEWKDIFKKLVQKSQPLKFNIRLLINQLTNGLILNDKNTMFFAKAMEKINTELDLHSLFYQLQEINKLKQVLLRKSQIILFNFSPKPFITLGESHITPSRLTIEPSVKRKKSKQIISQLNQELFGKLQRAYKEVIEDMQKNPSNLCQLNVNLKLTKLMGQDLQKLFVLPFQRRDGCLLLESNDQFNLDSNFQGQQELGQQELDSA